MSKVAWYFNRLSLMSPGEVAFRLSDEVKKRFEKMNYRDYVPDISLLEKTPRWYGEDLDKEEMIASFAANMGCLRERAEQFMEHKFSFFSFSKEDFGKEINWHKDYKTGKESPLKFCKTIDYRDFKKMGDIKYIWEINRHHHLITLAKAYHLLGKKEYKDEALKQIDNWIDANPYLMGVNWESSLELAVRMISWGWVWYFIKDEVSSGFKTKWLKSIYQHCQVISDNFSRYSSANNHLIGEAAGLFIASIVWPFQSNSERWQLKSFKILVKEMTKQDFPDGVNKEQALSYQQFVLDFFLLAGLLGEKNGIEFPRNYWGRMEKMIDFIASVMDKDGHVPQIGDADDGFAVILNEAENSHVYKSLLATGAAIFKRGDLKDKAGDIDEKTVWLVGNHGRRAFDRLKEKPYKGKKKFERGGYYILSDREEERDEIKAIVDCGPLGYLSIAAHGHSDALSLLLNVSGREILIDPGTYAYHTKRAWRDYFKGTSAHNTIRIDGEDQSLSGGNFMWLKKAAASVIKHHENDQKTVIVGEHNGYRRLKDPVWHRREIVFNKEERNFNICDRIEAEQEHIIEQFYHFSPQCQLTEAGQNKWLIENDDIRVEFHIDEKFKVNLCRGGELPTIGWYSARFDYKEPTCCLVNSYEGDGDVSFETKIIIAGDKPRVC